MARSLQGGLCKTDLTNVHNHSQRCGTGGSIMVFRSKGFGILAITAFILTGFAAAGAQSVTRLLELEDPLTGSTRGTRNGGQLTAAGWVTQTAFDYIEYKIPTCAAGEVQFKVKGIYASNEVFPNVGYDRDGKVVPGSDNVHYTLFGMYDRDDDASWYGTVQWHNPYKTVMHIYGYTAGDLFKWKRMKLRLNVAAFNGGYEDDPHAFEDPPVGPFEWEKEHVYQHRLVWGSGHMTWYLDGVQIKDWDYSSFGVEYAPPDHMLRLGSGLNSRSGGYASPNGLTYTDFKFYRYKDETPPQVKGMEPAGGSSAIAPDADILVHFSEPMDESVTQAAFSITPALAGSFKWIGAALAWEHSDLMQANTTYTVKVAATATDKAGLTLSAPFSATFTTRGEQAAEVGRYEPFEVTIKAPGTGGSRPYRDVSLKGLFKGPSQTIEIEGFWDGDDLWKVRMAPTELGAWSYQISGSSPALSRSGTFTCVASGSHGFVRRNPARPYSFMYDDGTTWLWKGDTSWRGFTSLLPYDGRWKEIIDLRSDQGYTAMQSIVNSYINGLGFWKNEGGTCFVEGADAKDYDQLNPGYFHWIDKRIDYALSKGIVPVILFSWAQEYVNFSSDQWENYVRYLVARFAAKNVIWVLCGEYNELPNDYSRPTSEFADWGTLVKKYDPYDHPITLHPTGRTSSAEFGSSSWMDVVMQQTPYHARDIQRDRVYNKPVVNAELGYMYPDQDNAASRYGLWEIVTTGGYYTNGFFTTYAPDKGGYDPAALPEEQRWVEFLNKLMDRLPIAEMEPHPEWTSAGQLLAKPGAEYLAYNRNGGAVTIDLTAVSGTLPVEWLDPRAGVSQSAGTVTGGAKQTLTPPFSGDWALHIGAGLRSDDVAPNPPAGLQGSARTMHSLTLTWNAPAAASDGDGASSYVIFRDGVQLTTVTAATYTDQGLEESSSYRYAVYSLDDAGNKSAAAAEITLSTTGDTQAPRVAAVTVVSATGLLVAFDEKVESASARNLANYVITPAVAVTAAVLSDDATQVTLTTAAHSAGQSYTITIAGVKDQARVANTMASQSLNYRFEATLQISELSPATYRVAQLGTGSTYYTDRELKLTAIPPVCQGFTWIMTENDDKERSDAHWLSFRTNLAATVMIAYDNGASTRPAWMEGWTDTGAEIVTTDDSPLHLYSRTFAAGEVVLGGNEGTSKTSMYLVLVKKSDGSVVDATPPSIPVGFDFAE